MHPHRTAELRSIAMHEVVAREMLANPRVLVRARDRVGVWLRDGGPVPLLYAHAWHELLEHEPSHVAKVIVVDDQHMRELRQNTPFAGVVPARERWDIIRSIR